MRAQKTRKTLDGRRQLPGPNPFLDLTDVELAGAAGRLVDELLEVRSRDAQARLDLAERCAYLLILCNQRLMRSRTAAPAPYAHGGFYPPALPPARAPGAPAGDDA